MVPRRQLTCQAGSREDSIHAFYPSRRNSEPARRGARSPAFAADKPLILISVPGMNFPFFVHMMKAFKAAADQQGLDTIEGDGRVVSQADR